MYSEKQYRLSRCRVDKTSLILTIGDISVRVESANKTFLRDLAVYYPHFVDRGLCDIEAHIHVSHHTLPFRDDIVVMREEGSIAVDGGEFKGAFCPASKEARFTMRAEKNLFDSFLRVFYSLILTGHDGFLVHAAGLEQNGRAYLFAGPSESGKTTTATMAGGFNVLNDELVLVKRKEGKFWLYATPFNGDYDRPIQNVSAPLSGFFFLDKHLEGAFKPVGQTKAMVQLLETVFFFDPDTQANQRVLDLCRQLASQFDAFKINIRSRKHLRDVIDDVSKEYSYT
jgi:hypothetical protein